MVPSTRLTRLSGPNEHALNMAIFQKADTRIARITLGGTPIRISGVALLYCT